MSLPEDGRENLCLADFKYVKGPQPVIFCLFVCMFVHDNLKDKCSFHYNILVNFSKY